MRVLLPLHSRAPQGAYGAEVWVLRGATMGTTWTVNMVPRASLRREHVQTVIEAALHDLTRLFSHWDDRSELSRFNQVPAGPVAASPPFLDLIDRCLEIARLTDGAVDPTLGALVDLWGFGPAGPRPGRDWPNREDIEDAHRRVGWARLSIDRPAGQISQPGGLRLDLSALAKGHAVDIVSQRLSDLGANSHLVEIGGELIGRGVKPDGQPWWVELDRGLTSQPDRAALFELAVATSGDSEKRVRAAGTTYSHTLDGRTGRPVDNGISSVTVFAETAFEADAWATALWVLGPETGHERAIEQHLAAAFVIHGAHGQSERTTPAWDLMATLG